MPYRLEWFEASKDESLPVYPELPAEYHELFSLGVREATLRGQQEGKPAFLHYCYRCGGWVPGLAGRYHEETLGVLSGRSGNALHCRRCGKEIAFLGMVS